MFQQLKNRWKVNSIQLLLIISTFAIGGSLCGRGSALLLNALLEEKNLIWWLLYIIIVTITWPVCVLAVSIPLGQLHFFRNYLTKVWKRISGQKKQ